MGLDQATQLQCTCGQVHLEVRKAPIIAATCYCNSCRDGGVRMAALPGAAPVMDADGGTPYVLYRKDRVTFTRGLELLQEFRLRPDSPTRRVVASCCNTPIFVEFQSGHWLSLYSGLWPDGTAPRAELRTQTDNLPDGTVLGNGPPAGAMATAGFYARLLGAWIAMGFRTPKVDLQGRRIEL